MLDVPVSFMFKSSVKLIKHQYSLGGFEYLFIRLIVSKTIYITDLRAMKMNCNSIIIQSTPYTSNFSDVYVRDIHKVVLK